MSQKEMLVELLKEALPENPLRGENCTCSFPSYEEIAEQMLDRIVVLPFRLGETVYAVDVVNVFDDGVPGNSRAEYAVKKVKYSLDCDALCYFKNKEDAENEAKKMNEILERERGY